MFRPGHVSNLIAFPDHLVSSDIPWEREIQMSRVDVIVPCYNYGRFLRECVESVLSQPVDLRVLIIDDCSGDDTPQVAAALAFEDRRVEFRRHEVNQGHIATYNEGLEWVSGDYNVLLSADDLLIEGALLRASRLMDANPDVGLVYGRVIWFRSGNERALAEIGVSNDGYTVIPGMEWIESLCREGSNRITSPEAMVRTRLQTELGGYRTELPHTADMEMWMRFAARCDVGEIHAPQAFYRVHGNNMSDSYYEKSPSMDLTVTASDLFGRKAAFDSIFHDKGQTLAEADRLHRLAYEGLGWSAFWQAHKLFDRGEASECQRFLNLASDFFPGIAARPEWTRMRWKQRMGPRAWSKLSRVFRGIRQGGRGGSRVAPALS
ncbi:GalNAc(5)-diNAcBac-PP-undecaprenol beta-1,3-glucosyltransferase [Aquisphaera giovannonii]|uniref:GalNAc(5)-diNAcBac-PP-undecaprenol beta-1,3-glucosyltransferase n=1 Tax=Aquisphaera giovannonii TaxID=406548 RepID=A0A5B9WD96_9BACT|nr:glycosyltransferase family 2 protein [Aquisphaera giovannonii]QEH37850.1 GalNAc(5)-diNAcBac-PP-undecaprenol beta-1,3-glucosyltransferase [Aquisphaera giovannonii]